jgi:hypothetical protein
MKMFSADLLKEFFSFVWDMTIFLRGFFAGALALVATLIVTFVVTAQYHDYAARVEVEQWLAWVDEMKIKAHIEANKANDLPLNAVEVLDTKKFYALGGKWLEITEDGMIVMMGGKEDRLVVLVPYFAELEGAVVWRCIGGPAKHIPAEKCQFPPTRTIYPR